MASFRYFGSSMTPPFHLLSNFNECRITGRVFVEQDRQRAGEGEREGEGEGEGNGGGGDGGGGGSVGVDDGVSGGGVSSGGGGSVGVDDGVSGGGGGGGGGTDGADGGGGSGGGMVEREFVFPCAEHYWWAHFTKNASDVSRLAVGGDLSTLGSGLRLLLGREKGKRKAEYWRKKRNVGIVSKMVAASPKSSSRIRCRAKDLGMEMGLHPLEQYGRQGDIGTLEAIWNKVQTDKYTQNAEHREVLRSTGSEALVEFVRMRPEGHMWGGQVRGGVKRSKGLVEGGELVGRNFMGNCLMTVRAAL